MVTHTLPYPNLCCRRGEADYCDIHYFSQAWLYVERRYSTLTCFHSQAFQYIERCNRTLLHIFSVWPLSTQKDVTAHTFILSARPLST